MTFHAFALAEAERVNPGGKHCVTSVEINGAPDEPGDVEITVATRVAPDAQTVKVDIRKVEL
jgi:hypothetical protein